MTPPWRSFLNKRRGSSTGTRYAATTRSTPGTPNCVASAKTFWTAAHGSSHGCHRRCRTTRPPAPTPSRELRNFTKRLVFSAWTVVPKAIAVMLSYEAERRAVHAASYKDRRYDDRPVTPPLQFRMSGDRPAGMPALALLYPGLVLARLGDHLRWLELPASNSRCPVQPFSKRSARVCSRR